MSIAAVTGVLYLSPPEPIAATMARLASALNRIEPYLGAPLSLIDIDIPESELNEMSVDVREGIAGARGVRHPVLLARTGRDHIADIRYRMEPGFGRLTLDSLLVTRDAGGVATAWGLVTDTVLKLLPAFQPTLAVITGDAVIPPFESMGAGELPEFFTPIVYIGPDRLTEERRHALGALPAYRTQALGEGWVVQAVPDLYHQPDKAFARELKRIPSRMPIRYRQPQAPRKATSKGTD